MPKYRIELRAIDKFIFELEAEDEDAAIKNAYDLYEDSEVRDDYYHDSDLDLEESTELSEEE